MKLFRTFPVAMKSRLASLFLLLVLFGGAFAGVRDVGVQEEIPTRLNGYEKTPEYSEWGHLIEVQYPYPGNRFDVQRVDGQRWGWRGE